MKRLLPPFTVLLFTLLFAGQTQAQNATLSVQGVLKKTSGAAVDDGDDYTLTFSLWTAESGGTEVWSEEITNVEVRGGVYSVVLGANGTDLDAAFDVPYFLGVKVGGSNKELTPRPRLTQAPYALSLLGQNNKIPSTGAISVDGVVFNNNVFNYNIGFDNNNYLNVNGDAWVKFNMPLYAQGNIYTDGSIRATNLGEEITGYDIIASNRIVVGQTTFTNVADLEVRGTGKSYNRSGNNFPGYNTNPPFPSGAGIAYSMLNVFPGDFNFNWVNNNPTTLAGILPSGVKNSLKISIYADHTVAAEHFLAFSDARIKNVLGQSNSAHDLATLGQLKITDYSYIDKIGKGNRLSKKVIAQEVEKVYPNAVSTITDVVPDIYRPAIIKNGRVTVANDLQAGERVQLIFDDQKEMFEVLTADAGGFTVACAKEGQVFVFGREVDDFRVVDYEALSTLNISATQELAKRLELLERENAALRTILEQQQTAFSTQVNALAQRLNTLEAAAGKMPSLRAGASEEK